MATTQSYAGNNLKHPVWNRKRAVYFGTLIDSGWFSAAPDDLAVNRAIRTNNPGAINISSWQRTRPGYIGQTAADSAGNKTTIYQTPEYGVAAWFFLLFDRYGFGRAGHFDVDSVARKYAGKDAKPKQVQAYIDGWSHWSNGALQPNTVIHFANNQELLVFAKAVFAHEAAAISPVHDDQIVFGFELEHGSFAAVAETTVVAIVGRGWELLVSRQVQHFKIGKRTYGTYQVYRDGVAVNHLAGYMCECYGPGDNEHKRSRKRIKEGLYPLWTQFGRYKTIGYSEDMHTVGTPPMPALRLEGTGNRDGILIHPGHPPRLYLSSIGCLNPTGPLVRNQKMDFWDSRTRVIALIDDLRQFAPAAFGHKVNTHISDAHVVLVGEP